jgi:hypothetical protein
MVCLKCQVSDIEFIISAHRETITPDCLRYLTFALHHLIPMALSMSSSQPYPLAHFVPLCLKTDAGSGMNVFSDPLSWLSNLNAAQNLLPHTPNNMRINAIQMGHFAMLLD